MFQQLWIPVAAAFILDTLLGDPRWLPHPVRWLGHLAAAMESLGVKLLGRSRPAGFLALFGVILTAGIPWILLLLLLKDSYPWVYQFLSVLTIYYSFALKDLSFHGKRVFRSLLQRDIQAARRDLSFMVSRETGEMEEKQLIGSTLESLSENFSDSVIAPLFFALIFGPGGAWIYRILNTLDALWGYRNERYGEFGFAAAKTDDLINWLPARLSGLLLAATACLLPGCKGSEAFRIFLRDGKKHKSPNSGYPEAAAAGALGAGFGGAVIYHGKAVENPRIGEGTVLLAMIPRLIRLNFFTALAFLGIAAAILYLFTIYLGKGSL